MRLGILIRDSEYRKALVDKLASYDNDIFVNVIDGNNSDTSECLILTDILPEEIDRSVLDRIRKKTVFISDKSSEIISDEDGNDAQIAAVDTFHKVFKFDSVSTLISELSLVYNEWHGSVYKKNYSAKTIAVCSEYDSFSSDKCMSLARQIVYLHGGNVLVISLDYINDYGRYEAAKSNRFARLMYSISSGRCNTPESFTYTDSYGISALMLPQGRNPVAYLNEDELRLIISGLSDICDTLILDIGTCYRKENLSVIEDTENIIFFMSGRRNIDPARIIGNEAAERTARIMISGEAEEASRLDDVIKQIYGI